MAEQLPRGVEWLPSRECFRASVWNDGKRITKCFATVEEATAFRAASHGMIAAGTATLATGELVKNLGASWLRTYRSTLRSYGNDRQRWYSHVDASPIARMPVDAVEEHHVEAWLRELVAKGLAVRTQKNCRSLLSRFFADHVRARRCTVNPVAEVLVVGDIPPVAEDWYLTPAEQRRFLDAIPQPERWIIAAWMAMGLRRGELFALHLGDVHLDDADGYPYVMVKFGGFAKGGSLRTPKNMKTRRVPLVGMAEDSLRRWLAALPLYAPSNPHELVFPCPSGARRVYSRDVPSSFKVAAKKIARIKPWPHLLRHTCASSLVAGWWGEVWSLHQVCKFLGHSSIAVTERYAHLAPSSVDEKARRTSLTPLTAESFTRAESFVETLSRPGDLKPGPTQLFSKDPAWRERVVSALGGLLSGDPVATSRAVVTLAELLPPAERKEVERAG